MFNDIIDAMCKDQLVNEAYGLFSEMAVKGATVVTYNSLTYGFCIVGKLKEATGLLNEMVSKTINPNVYTLVDAWCKRKRRKGERSKKCVSCDAESMRGNWCYLL